MKRLLALLLCAALLIPACAAAAETAAQQTAEELALEYLEALYFSRDGLVSQLVFEGYPEDESAAAVDRLEIDWFDQAEGYAGDILEYDDTYSELSMAQLLLNSGFSPEEAKYGASAAFGGSPEKPAAPAGTEAADATPVPVPDLTPVPEGVPIPLSTPTPAPAAGESAPTEKQLAALADAKDYTENFWFSRRDLYVQLIKDGYSEEEAQYAADNVGMNWYTEAYGLALDVRDGIEKGEYGDFSEYSEFIVRGGIEQYLIGEGYTGDEAKYGVAAAFGDTVDLPSVTPVPAPLPVGEELLELLESGASATPAPTEPEYTPVPEWGGWGQTVEVSTATPEPVITPAPAQVTIQTSWLSTEELIALRKQIDEEIHSRPEWKQVDVPTGTWTVGEDIPAGTYSIRGTGRYGTVYIYPAGASSFDDFYSIDGENVIGRIELQDGWKVEVTAPVIFAPPEAPAFQ